MVTLYDDDLAKLQERIRDNLQRRQPRLIRSDWQSRSGLAYWLGYLRHDPREFAYAVPRRIACRALRRHNLTFVGRPAPHPRRW